MILRLEVQDAAQQMEIALRSLVGRFDC